MSLMFSDRRQTGRLLAQKITAKIESGRSVISALPRGGVIVGFEIADRFVLPLTICITRKIAHPDNPEYAIGAVGEHSAAILNLWETKEIDPDWLQAEIDNQRREITRRRHIYMPPEISLENKVVILVDDGVATGYTMMAAIRETRLEKPAKIIVAIPVIPADVAKTISQQVDELIALEVAATYRGAVGSYYRDFFQVADQEVIDCLLRAGSGSKHRA